jgi:WD40 repeat protein
VRSPVGGAIRARIECDLPRISALAFHPRGHLLAVAGGDPGVRGETRLLAWPKGTVLQRFTNGTDLATSVAFNSTGALMGVGSGDHLARVWRATADGDPFVEAFTLTGHAGPVLSIAFSPTGQTIVTAGVDRSLKVWSATDGRLVRAFNHHLEIVNALAFRPLAGAETNAPGFCASASDDRTLRVWQPEIGRMVRIVRQHRGPIFAVTWAADGRSVFSAGKEGVIRRFDAESDTVLSEWPDHTDWIYALALSPDGTKLASGDWAGQVRIRDLRP